MIAPDPWRTIESKLADGIGLDPGTVGKNLIPRAVRLRMMELGLEDVQAYATLLSRSEVEIEALIEEVVVPESWFFRDETPFRMLQDHARTGWLDQPARDPLRVLSIPCAAGEEPYSITIALLEIGLPAERFRVDGVDVSARRLEQARRGVYSANAFRGAAHPFRDRYFEPVPQGFALAPLVRGQVRFRRASILDPTLLQGESRYDVIFCRNLLIYLNRSSRGRALAVIDRLLDSDGLLFIGHADRLGQDEEGPRFSPIGDRAAFAYCRAAAPPVPPSPVTATCSRTSATSAAAAPVPPSPVTLTQPPRKLPQPPCGVEPHVPSRLSSAPSSGKAPGAPPPASQPSDKAGPGARESLLGEAARLANDGRFREAIAACEQAIKRHGPSSAAYFLMGMIHRTMGELAVGEECFSRAVYLDPGHDEALLALALCAERRGDMAAAAGFRRRAERRVEEGSTLI